MGKTNCCKCFSRPQKKGFCQESSLHGVKYIESPGCQRVVWILILLLSCSSVTYVFRGALSEYFGDNMKMLVNSTNTPVEPSDFPVITVCNVNMRSATLTRIRSNLTINTYRDARELAQPCSDLVSVCLYRYDSCQTAVVQVLTEAGWCCQVDIRKLNSTYRHSPMGANGVFLLLDIEAYDYSFPIYLTEGVLLTVDGHGSYPSPFAKATVLAPGTNNFVRLAITKTYTTDDALAKSSEKRNCLTKDEVKLKHFEEYTQDNCLVDDVITKVGEACGCVGKHRGFGNSTDHLEECRVVGSMAALKWSDYEQCFERNTSVETVLCNTVSPIECMVNCEETKFSTELSFGNSPGFMSSCPDPDLYTQVACMFNNAGRALGWHVCETLELFSNESGPVEKNKVHWKKRSSLCTEGFQKLWESCGGSLGSDVSLVAPSSTVDCLRTKATVDEVLQAKEVLDLYERENIIQVEIMVKERYYTSIKRDVSYTLPSLIANVGGLLGLSMGCSLISIAELLIYPMMGLVALRSTKRRKTLP